VCRNGRRRSWPSEAQDCSSDELNVVSGFLQSIAVEAVLCAQTHPELDRLDPLSEPLRQPEDKEQIVVFRAT
jgi:hypothetical protein